MKVIHKSNAIRENILFNILYIKHFFTHKNVKNQHNMAITLTTFVPIIKIKLIRNSHQTSLKLKAVKKFNNDLHSKF